MDAVDFGELFSSNNHIVWPKAFGPFKRMILIFALIERECTHNSHSSYINVSWPQPETLFVEALNHVHNWILA